MQQATVSLQSESAQQRASLMLVCKTYLLIIKLKLMFLPSSDDYLNLIFTLMLALVCTYPTSSHLQGLGSRFASAWTPLFSRRTFFVITQLCAALALQTCDGPSSSRVATSLANASYALFFLVRDSRFCSRVFCLIEAVSCSMYGNRLPELLGEYLTACCVYWMICEGYERFAVPTAERLRQTEQDWEALFETDKPACVYDRVSGGFRENLAMKHVRTLYRCPTFADFANRCKLRLRRKMEETLLEHVSLPDLKLPLEEYFPAEISCHDRAFPLLLNKCETHGGKQCVIYVERKESENGCSDGRQNRLRTLLLNTLSHNIRNPLNGLRFLLEQIKAYCPDDAEANGLFVNITNNLKLLMLKTDDFMDLALIMENRFELHKELFGIRELIDELRENVDDGRGVLRLKFVGEVSDQVFSDRGKLLRIITHLLLNGLKYTKEGSVELTVKNTSRMRKLKFIVTDTGVGIAPERKQKLCRFLAAEFPEDVDFDGKVTETGIGLFITNKLCQRLGSKLRIESIEGQGTTFRFSILIADRKHFSSKKTLLRGSSNEMKSNRESTTLLQDGTASEAAKVDRDCDGEENDNIPDELNNSDALNEIGCLVEKGLCKRYPSFQLKHNKTMEKCGYKPSLFIPENSFRRVLVVDDAQINRSALVFMINKTGNYIIDEATNGKEAIDLVNTNSYEMIFMDLEMPVMDGFEATKAIRAMEEGREPTFLRPRIPIVAVTAYDTPDIISYCYSIGIDYHLVKPVTLRILNDTLRKVQNSPTHSRQSPCARL